jgi:uncharacterized protein (DUF779 family)
LAVHVTSELSNTSFNTSNAALNCLLAATLPFIGACTLALAHSGLLFTQSSGTLSGIPPNLSPRPPVLAGDTEMLVAGDTEVLVAGGLPVVIESEGPLQRDVTSMETGSNMEK